MRDTLDAREPCDDMLEIGDSGAGDVAIVACALLSGVRIMVSVYRSITNNLNRLLDSSLYHPLDTALH